MTVDDAGRRAGATLRERFDGRVPPLPDLTVEPPHRGRRGALVGIAVVVVVAVLVALFASSRDPEPAAGPGGTWKRIDMTEAFGPREQPSSVVAAGPGFVAVGGRRGANGRTDAHPMVWTSSDGEHWQAVSGLRFLGGRFPGFGSIAVHRGVMVTSADGTELWRSTDAQTWRRIVRLGRNSRDGAGMTIGPRGFLAIDSTPFIWSNRVVASPNGRHWRGTDQIGTMDRPVGLFPQAQLGSRAISGGFSINHGPPLVYSSADGVHWRMVADATTPMRLEPAGNNRRRTRVLGIEFENAQIPGSFGGRLWSTRDARHWTEVASFHEQMPVANPDHIVQSRGWWVLGGNTGTPDGKRRASMWSSPDLRHWYEMPKELRGPKTDGDGVTVTSGGGRAIGMGGRGQLWAWSPPS